VIEIMKRAQIRSIAGYIIIGTVIWLCTLKSGVHPTVAGVFLGLATPVRPFMSRISLTETLKSALARLQQKEPTEQVHERDAVEQINFASTEALSPLERLEHRLHPWVSFLIMPIFALANAGVKISGEAVIDPVALGVAGGLVIGKPIGIAVAAWLVIKAGWAKLPEQTGWLSVLGAGALAGIGFTMSLFVASLSMEGNQLAAAKMGVLVGSAVSILIGMSALAMRRTESA
jgi:NhaA family Na+:H+ antiporter